MGIWEGKSHVKMGDVKYEEMTEIEKKLSDFYDENDKKQKIVNGKSKFIFLYILFFNFKEK